METTLERALARWHDAHLLTDDQVSDIRTWEAGRNGDGPSGDTGQTAAPEAPSHEGTSLVAEGLAYVGAALALGAGFALFGELWADLGSAARIALSAVGTGIVGSGAFALRERREGSLHRLATVLAALTVVGTAGTLGIAMAELTAVEGGWIAAVAGGGALLVAVPVHWVRASWPTTLVMGAALLTTLFGIESVLGLVDDALPAGITLVGIGLAWAAAGWSGLARPRSAFEVTGLLAGGVGVQTLAIEVLTVPALLLGLVVAGGAMAVGLSENRTSPAVLGGLGITVFAPQLVFELFGETVGGPLALFVGGISLVTVAVIILRRKDVL
jgi:hypothetical protein